MTLVREFNLYLTAGKSIPLVINVNQFDSGEQWVFTLYKEDGTQYTPSTGAIVGIKSDGYLIANAGTVDGQGRVVITETQQMTASAGKAIFELQIDNETHGTANFIVLVEPDPSNNGIASGSDIGLLRDALNGGLSQAAIDALLACFENVAWVGDDGQDYYDALEAALNAVRGIYLDVSTLSFVGSGQTQQLTATTVPAGGTVSWESSNTSVATVSSSGLVTSAGVGTATITASSGDVSATCSVTVTQATLVSISAVFTQGSAVIYDTDSLDTLKQYLVVTATYDNSATETVPSADYTLSGTLTVGTSTITVTYNEKTTTFNATVSAGVPSGYTVYDYVQVANRADSATTTNVAPPASWIVLNEYDNLDVLSWDFKFSPLTGYTRGSAIIGARMDSGITTGDGVYIGSVASSAIGESNRSRMIAHGVYQVYSSNAVTLDAVNTLVFTNTSESPSEFAFNGVATELPWTTTLTVTKGLTLFTNPTPTATTMFLVKYLRIGALKLYDLSGSLVGDYVPCVRNSDTRIGMFDRATQTFFTSSTASYTTVGNSSCYYTVGNWS